VKSISLKTENVPTKGIPLGIN